MHRFVREFIQSVIPPNSAISRLGHTLQRLRRRSFRVCCDSDTRYFSQTGQDKFLNERVFGAKRDGTFVDIGAADGVFLSNTYFFEKELAWCGVCVEPRPEAFSRLVASRR